MVLSRFFCAHVRVKCTYSKRTVSEAAPEPLNSWWPRTLLSIYIHIATDQHNMLQKISSGVFLEYSRLFQRQGGQR